MLIKYGIRHCRMFYHVGSRGVICIYKRLLPITASARLEKGFWVWLSLGLRNPNFGEELDIWERPDRKGEKCDNSSILTGWSNWTSPRKLKYFIPECPKLEHSIAMPLAACLYAYPSWNLVTKYDLSPKSRWLRILSTKFPGGRRVQSRRERHWSKSGLGNMLFDRSRSVFSMTPLKKHMEYFMFLC